MFSFTFFVFLFSFLSHSMFPLASLLRRLPRRLPLLLLLLLFFFSLVIGFAPLLSLEFFCVPFTLHSSLLLVYSLGFSLVLPLFLVLCSVRSVYFAVVFLCISPYSSLLYSFRSFYNASFFFLFVLSLLFPLFFHISCFFVLPFSFCLLFLDC